MKSRVLLIAAIIVVAVIAGLTWGVRRSLQRPVKLHGDPVIFTVSPGESFASIRQRLHDAGFISHPRVFSLYAKVRGLDRRIHVGSYELEAGERPVDILNALVTGDVYKVKVTIPEGYLLRQIAGVLQVSLHIDSIAFTDVTRDADVLDGLAVDAPSLEGYLFPDTYFIPWGAGAADVSRVMMQRLNVEYGAAEMDRATTIGMTRNEVLTLASIIEAEARLPEERRKVSAVYHNRLKKGMRLEADPTVAYAMGGYKGRLFFKDLEIDSPYNTYKNRGLPPGPICSPGASSIHAALYPDSTCDALYFVAQGDGGHVFSLTLREHQAAVRKVRRERDSK